MATLFESPVLGYWQISVGGTFVLVCLTCAALVPYDDECADRHTAAQHPEPAPEPAPEPLP